MNEGTDSTDGIRCVLSNTYVALATQRSFFLISQRNIVLNVVVAVIVESTLAMSKKRNDDIIETLEHDRRDSIFQAPADSCERVTVTVEFAPSPTAKVHQGRFI